MVLKSVLFRISPQIFHLPPIYLPVSSSEGVDAVIQNSNPSEGEGWHLAYISIGRSEIPLKLYLVQFYQRWSYMLLFHLFACGFGDANFVQLKGSPGLGGIIAH